MQRILLFSIFLFVFQVFGFGKAGGEITYKALGNDKYDVTFKYYRDCRAPINTISFFLYTTTGGKTLSLSPKLESVKDISTTCKTADKCNPSNSQLSTTTPVFEQHTYKCTIDFNGNESSFKTYCAIKIYMAVCCRDGKINTGSGGSYFYISSDLEICNVKNNSSPIFISDPVNTAILNAPVFQLFTARDTVDNDSLSYHFTEPLDGLTSAITWNKGYSYNEPIVPYWPPSYDKNKGPNPNLNPPIGIYLAPQTGELIFLPTDMDITPICIAVKEWRKDSTGKYFQIGEVRREVTLTVNSFNDNNQPLLNGPYSYSVCAGNQICFTISSDDKQFIPAPPQIANPPDTVTLTWNSVNIKGATFTIVDTTARLKKLKFCWTPTESDASDVPYSFSVTGRDNFCPMNGIVVKNYLVTVKPIAKTKTSIKNISNNVKVFDSQITKPFKNTPYYYWDVMDSNQMLLSKSYFFFKQSKSTSSIKSSDTAIFRKAGKYFVKHIINNPPLNCPTVYFDTIIIPKVMDVSFYKTFDTTVCKGVTLPFKAMVVNGTSPYSYKWGTGKPDTVSQFTYKAIRDSTIELEVTDALGQKAYSWVKIKVFKTSVNAGADKTICKNDSTNLSAAASNFGGTISYSWFYKGNKVGSQSVLEATNEGVYRVEATDNIGCFSKDSVSITNLLLPPILLKDGSYCQNKNSLAQKELIIAPANINLYKSAQWQLLKTLKNPKGIDNTLTDLLTDTDTTLNYNFLLVMDKSTIDLGPKLKDSLILMLTVTGDNSCKNSDIATIVIAKAPTLNFKYTKKEFCRSEVLDLDSLVSHDGDTQIWTKVNATGYQNYPATGEVKNGIIAPNDFDKQGGLYKIYLTAKIDDCETNGSMGLNVLPNPLPIIEKKEGKDSVMFTDKSSFAHSRSWYLDTSFISNAASITLAKNLVNGKSISLKLKNDNCEADTQFTFHAAGIKNIKNDLIKIYPNPANDILTIQQVKPLGNGTFEIYNTIGELVSAGDLMQKETFININTLASGLYFLKVSQEKMTVSFQFVKTDK